MLATLISDEIVRRRTFLRSFTHTVRPALWDSHSALQSTSSRPIMALFGSPHFDCNIMLRYVGCAECIGMTVHNFHSYFIHRWKRHDLTETAIIKCSFSIPLGSTRQSSGSTFDANFGDRAIAVAGLASYYQQQSGHLTICKISRTSCKLTFLMDHFFFVSIYHDRGRPWNGLHVTAPKKLTLYYYFHYYSLLALIICSPPCQCLGHAFHLSD